MMILRFLYLTLPASQCYDHSMIRKRDEVTGSWFNDLTGDKIGRWTVIAMNGRRGAQSVWHCRCQCGRQKRGVLYGSLTTGASQSCGCLRTEQLKAAAKHGKSRARIYHVWQQMKVRCSDPTRREWKNYGGRGIGVCERWMGKDGFENFAADMGEPGWGLSLDRINNDGNYEPGNCRWATKQEQQRNRRDNRWLHWKDGRWTVTDVARMEGVAFCSLRNMVAAGVEVGRAVGLCRERGLKFKERAKFLL